MKNILIVDDSEGMRDIMHLLLKDLCNPLIAASGTEALAILNETKIHIIVSDLEMPKGDGRWLLQESQKLKDPPHVIIISGNINVDVDQMMKEGALTVLPKPFKAKLLLELITPLLTEA